SGADRYLGAHDLVAPVTDGDPAAQELTVRDPDRAALGAERGQDPVEHGREQLIEVERRAELQADRLEQAEALDFVAQLVPGRGGSAHDRWRSPGKR